MSDQYTQTCPDYVFGGKKFAYRDSNTLVKSFPGVSESFLYKNNDYGKINTILTNDLKISAAD